MRGIGVLVNIPYALLEIVDTSIQKWHGNTIKNVVNNVWGDVLPRTLVVIRC
jgi:hypothetical protein